MCGLICLDLARVPAQQLGASWDYEAPAAWVMFFQH